MKKNLIKNIILSEKTTFSERIKIACRIAGSTGRLSKYSGVSTTAIDKYKYSNSEPTRPSLIAIAEAVELPLEWLATGKHQKPEKPIEQKSISLSTTTISMKGFAQCGLSGWFNEFDTGEQFTFSIPDTDAFAVMAIGLSMVPASIKQGAICIVSPNSSINVSDIVYVERNDGTSSIKKLISQDENWVTLQGWLDPDMTGQQQPYTDQISRSVINKIHPVLWIKSKPM